MPAAGAKKRETKSICRSLEAAVTLTPRIAIAASREKSGRAARTSASVAT
jgi:hypothetical protein